MKLLDAGKLDLATHIRAGDTVVWGQIAGEPQTLTEALVQQRAGIGRFQVFLGGAFSRTLAPEHADFITFRGLGPAGTHRRLAAAGVFDVLPIHLSHIEPMLHDGTLPCEVALIQVSPANERGEYSYGITGDYLPAAVRKARVVIAEINRQVPWTYNTTPLTAADIDYAIETDRPLVEVAAQAPSETDRRIAAATSRFIADRSTLQMGIGAVPEALLMLIRDRRGLGIHSGIIGEGVAALMRDGIVDNAHKGIDAGVTITGTILGSAALYRYFDHNPALRVAPVSYTHAPQVVRQLAGFVSINSALEVDLTGQVNSEALGDSYLGAVGGQVDYVRAAASSGGRSIIALPSTAGGGKATRIVAKLSGPVTTARSDVDVIVTEHGAAQLRGQSISQRARAMLAICDPAHREALERQAHELFKASPSWR